MPSGRALYYVNGVGGDVTSIPAAHGLSETDTVAPRCGPPRIARGRDRLGDGGGHHRDIDSYSAFLEADRRTSTGLAGYLKERGFRKLYICGLATDFCVAWSACDARKAGFEVVVIEDACRAIDTGGSLAAAWHDMDAAGVKRISSRELASPDRGQRAPSLGVESDTASGKRHA